MRTRMVDGQLSDQQNLEASQDAAGASTFLIYTAETVSPKESELEPPVHASWAWTRSVQRLRSARTITGEAHPSSEKRTRGGRRRTLL